MASSRIYRTMDELRKRETIPRGYLTNLEDRLVTTCKSNLGRLQRGAVRRTMQESRLKSAQRKAKKVYVDILNEDPNIFLPFILTISEKACHSFDVSQFCQNHKKEARICLNLEAKNILEDIATRHDLYREPNYKKLEDFLFPQPKPITRADSNEHWAYSAASLNATCNFFGDRIFNAIENSPIRLREQASLTTERVRMKFPKENFQDVVLTLDVGLDCKLVSDLFPRESEKLFALLQAHPSNSMGPTVQVGAITECLGKWQSIKYIGC